MAENELGANDVETKERKRGGCLTVVIILMLIFNPLVGLYYLYTGIIMRESIPLLPNWAILLMGLLALANFAFAIGIWKWKRWGVYGFFGSAAVAFLINILYLGIQALFGIVGLVILVALLRPVWHQME